MSFFLVELNFVRFFEAYHILMNAFVQLSSFSEMKGISTQRFLVAKKSQFKKALVSVIYC